MVNLYFNKKNIKSVSYFHKFIDRDKHFISLRMLPDSSSDFVLIIESS